MEQNRIMISGLRSAALLLVPAAVVCCSRAKPPGPEPVPVEQADSLSSGPGGFADGGVAPPPDGRPNVIYIMLDDMAHDMMPGMGRYPFIDMPNLLRMQREGVTFRNYFAVMSLSAPSRATNLTGTYPHINGIMQNLNNVDPDWNVTPTFGKYLQESGYSTAFIGKVHMASASAFRGRNHIRPGFDYWVSFYGQGSYENPLILDNGLERNVNGYMTDILNNYALNWIKGKRDKNKPFAMCLWHKAVHGPFTPADRHQNVYNGNTIAAPPWDTHLDDLSTKPVWQRAKIKNIHENVPAFITPSAWTGTRSAQWGQLRTLKAVDDSLGDILALLEEEGILDNTVIMFSSDNGYFHGEHQFGDKRIAYENSIRIPLMVRFPKAIQAGSEINDLCLNIDIAPTILDYAGVPTPSQMQGESMKGLMEGVLQPGWRRSFFYEYYSDDAQANFDGPNLTAVRTRDYKYVENNYIYQGHQDIYEFYDLTIDPGEMTNRINDPLYADIIADLKRQLGELKVKYAYNPDRYWRRDQMYPQ